MQCGYKTKLKELEKRYIINANGTIFDRLKKKLVPLAKDSKGYMRIRIYAPDISKNKDRRRYS